MSFTLFYRFIAHGSSLRASEFQFRVGEMSDRQLLGALDTLSGSLHLSLLSLSSLVNVMSSTGEAQKHTVHPLKDGKRFKIYAQFGVQCPSPIQIQDIIVQQTNSTFNIYHLINNHDFVSLFFTFFYSIFNRIWFHKKEKKKRENVLNIPLNHHFWFLIFFSFSVFLLTTEFFFYPFNLNINWSLSHRHVSSRWDREAFSGVRLCVTSVRMNCIAITKRLASGEHRLYGFVRSWHKYCGRSYFVLRTHQLVSSCEFSRKESVSKRSSVHCCTHTGVNNLAMYVYAWARVYDRQREGSSRVVSGGLNEHLGQRYDWFDWENEWVSESRRASWRSGDVVTMRLADWWGWPS